MATAIALVIILGALAANVILLFGILDAVRHCASRNELEGILNRLEDIEEAVSSTRDTLVEASRIKAQREQPGDPGSIQTRAAIRRGTFVGLAQRREEAERKSREALEHSAKVRANNARAMEG